MAKILHIEEIKGKIIIIIDDKKIEFDKEIFEAIIDFYMEDKIKLVDKYKICKYISNLKMVTNHSTNK